MSQVAQGFNPQGCFKTLQGLGVQGFRVQGFRVLTPPRVYPEEKWQDLSFVLDSDTVSSTTVSPILEVYPQ